MTRLKDAAYGDTLARYPESPGWKAPGTSQQAAARIAPQVKGLRAKVLGELRTGGAGTPDEVAERLGLSILSIRPRFSELFELGQIARTGQRRANTSGHGAEEWRIAP